MKLQMDFTQGSIPRHLVLFSLPMFAGSILQALYNTVDSIWVGRFLGANALGAVSVSFPLIMALLSLVFGLTMASTTLVSQYRGAREEAKVRRTVATSLLLLGTLGAMLSVIGVVFRNELLSLVAPPEEIFEQAASYFGIFMGGILGMFLYNVLSSLLRGLGDSRTPLKFLAIATVVNIALDPLLIFGFGPIPAMGVGGAALATILSQALSSVLLWRWMQKNTDLMPSRREDWMPDWQIMKLIFKVGLPSGLQQAAVSFGMVFVMKIITSFGSEVVAAFGAASRLDQFGFMPAMAIGMAVSAVVGQNLGAGRFDRVRSTVNWSCGIAAGLTLIITLVAVFKPTVLMVLFTDDPGVLAAGSEYLRIMGPAYVAFALIFILGGVLRGAGDTFLPLIFTLVALWGVRVPAAYFLSQMWGTSGIWIGVAVSPVVGLALHWVYYVSGRWKAKVVVRKAGAPVAAVAD